MDSLNWYKIVDGVRELGEASMHTCRPMEKNIVQQRTFARLLILNVVMCRNTSDTKTKPKNLILINEH